MKAAEPAQTPLAVAAEDALCEPPTASPPTTSRLLRRFLPLAFSDLAMLLGDPLCASTLSRLPSPQTMLAAMGIMKSVAVFLESPVIMILHASTTLCHSRRARQVLWKFTLWLTGIMTGLFVLLNYEPIYRWLFLSVFDANMAIADAARVAFWIMVPWPAVIGIRRYFQGWLIYKHKERQIAVASFMRLGFAIAMLSIGLRAHMQGAVLAALTFVGAVAIEALLVVLFAQKTPDNRPLVDSSDAKAHDDPRTLGQMSRFYAPLASTMLFVWGGRAMLVAIVARSSDGSLALATWTAAWSFVLPIANATRMVQQVLLTCFKAISRRTMLSFLGWVGFGCSVPLWILGFSPQGYRALLYLLGDNVELAMTVAKVMQLALIFPLLVVTQNALQAFLIFRRRSHVINIATLIGIACGLAIAGYLVSSGSPGAIAAVWAMNGGLVIELLALAVSISYLDAA